MEKAISNCVTSTVTNHDFQYMFDDDKNYSNWSGSYKPIWEY